MITTNQLNTNATQDRQSTQTGGGFAFRQDSALGDLLPLLIQILEQVSGRVDNQNKNSGQSFFDQFLQPQDGGENTQGIETRKFPSDVEGGGETEKPTTQKFPSDVEGGGTETPTTAKFPSDVEGGVDCPKGPDTPMTLKFPSDVEGGGTDTPISTLKFPSDVEG